MVKPDSDRDYYADLGLSSNCSQDDIKIEYKKAARLTHPDRNPSNQIECTALFQAIQAAYEVLSDPTQRAKYDSSRRRNNVNSFPGSRPTPPPRPTNPYQAHSEFPTPYMRTGATRRAGQNAAAPNSGAERYTEPFRTAPHPPRRDRPDAPPPSGRQGADQRRDAWQSFHHAQREPMRSNSHGGPSGVNTNPRRTPAKPETSPLRTAWETLRKQEPNLRRSASGRTQSRTGFDPTSPIGDEGPARNTTYDRAPYNAPPPPVPPRTQAPTASIPSPPKAGFETEAPYVEAERVRTPYMAHPENKTYFDRDEMKRSASTRDSTWPDQQQTEQNNSGDAIPGQKTTSHRQNGDAKDHKFATYSSSETSDEDDLHKSSSPSSDAQERKKAQPSPAWAKRNASSPLSRSQTYSGLHVSSAGKETDGAGARPPKLFSFPIQPDTFDKTTIPTMRSHSSDNVDTNFSDGTIPAAFSRVPQPPEKVPLRDGHSATFPIRGRVPSRSYDTSPTQPQQTSQTATARPPFAADATAHSSGDTFFPDHWAKTIQEDNWASRWAYGPSPLPGVSPTRNSANSRRPRGGGFPAGFNGPSRAPGAPHPASMDEEELGDPSKFTGSNLPSPLGNEDADAMDIDPPAKHVRVDLPRPEWPSQGQSQPRTVNGARRASMPNNTFNINTTIPPLTPSSTRPLTSTPADSSINFTNFRTVPPLSKITGAGLNDLGDISNQLPFPSQPSLRPPLLYKEQMNLPKPPKPPLPPSDLTQISWTYYDTRMKTYLNDWNDFDAQMVSHFQSRNTERSATLDKISHGSETGNGSRAGGSNGATVQNWLNATTLGDMAGERMGPGPLADFVNMGKEDERMRMHWQVACERCADAVAKYGRLLEEVSRTGLQG